MEEKDFKKLLIWQKADKIFDMVCEDVRKWPNDPISNSIKYQLLDSSGSISANIAEGYGRGTPGEFEQFLRYSRASMVETDNWLLKANKQGYIDKKRYEQYETIFCELKRMMASFINRLRKQSKRNHSQ